MLDFVFKVSRKIGRPIDDIPNKNQGIRPSSLHGCHHVEVCWRVVEYPCAPPVTALGARECRRFMTERYVMMDRVLDTVDDAHTADDCVVCLSAAVHSC